MSTPTLKSQLLAISTRFKTQVIDVINTPTERVKFIQDNDTVPTPFPPESPDAAGGLSIIRVHLLPGESQQISIGSPGNNRFRMVGILMPSVFIPGGSGDADGYDFYDTIATPFQSKNIGGIIYKTASPKVVGSVGAWWQINVICTWQFDYIA